MFLVADTSFNYGMKKDVPKNQHELSELDSRTLSLPRTFRT